MEHDLALRLVLEDATKHPEKSHADIVLDVLSSDSEWYNVRKLHQEAKDRIVLLHFIAGKRRIGKTVLFLNAACLLWEAFGDRTMWIRNKQVELEADGFKDTFLSSALRLGFADPEWETKKDGAYEGEERFILFQSISTYSNRRGGETAEVLLMVFDEYQPEDRRYPKMAHKGLMSLTKTVLSGNTQARVFCLSNYVSAANPYWMGFQVYPEKGKDITLFPDKAIAIEVCRGYKCAIEENNPWNMIYRAGGYQDYADETEDALFALVVERVPKGCNPADHVYLVAGALYMPWVAASGIVYYAIHKGSLPRDTVIMTDDIQSCSDTVQLVPTLYLKALRDAVAVGKVRFVGANTMYAVLSMAFEAI